MGFGDIISYLDPTEEYIAVARKEKVFPESFALKLLVNHKGISYRGIVVNGLINISISTIEKRYELNSSLTGLISASYDMAFCLLSLFVSYFGERGHKPRWLAFSAFMLGLGSLVFSLPHFSSGKYQYGGKIEDTCRTAETTFANATCSASKNSSLRKYLYVFILGQLLLGIGGTPLYTLGTTFIDDSVPKHKSSLYIGTAKIQAEKISETHDDGGQVLVQTKNIGQSFKDFPMALLILLRNPVLMSLIIASSSEALVATGFATFLPKFIENQFGKSSSSSATLGGLVLIPGAALGQLKAYKEYKMEAITVFLGQKYKNTVCSGTIPGPILFGVAIDKSCTLWDINECETKGVCWVYDNERMAYLLMSISAACKIVTIVFVVMAVYFYKPPPLTKVLSQKTSEKISVMHT
ncbi:Solute carrier organic anion transporter family member 4C1 [Lonchura striata]|uniref:Solute carrier organic anion transporter family member 4C1 n=1 Tax=Lonchura striata TaxID=40157 RepID=A0A218UCS3_9PASE|nr:Solute carrier organic anion transporter family member 4C1 [Lonchura striata domestica]